jgi:hypothetical protein
MHAQNTNAANMVMRLFIFYHFLRALFAETLRSSGIPGKQPSTPLQFLKSRTCSTI